jgi:hypothetical protein
MGFGACSSESPKTNISNTPPATATITETPAASAVTGPCGFRPTYDPSQFLPQRIRSISLSSLRPGDEVVVSADGFAPAVKVEAFIHRPGTEARTERLAEGTTDAAGAVTLIFRMPALGQELRFPGPGGWVDPCVAVTIADATEGVAVLLPYSD